MTGNSCDLKKDQPGAGQPPFEPTDQERGQVEAMSGFGVPVKSIAAIIRGGISDNTLMKHFRKELDQGRAKAQAQVGKSLFQNCISGNVTAQIFYAKTQMGWKEPPQQIEVSNHAERFLADVRAMEQNLIGEDEIDHP